MAPSHALAFREGAAKRWTGVHAGGLLSLEMLQCGVPTRYSLLEGNTVGGVFASRQRAPRGRRTWHACDLSMFENREVPRSPACGDGRAGRAGNTKVVIP